MKFFIFFILILLIFILIFVKTKSTLKGDDPYHIVVARYNEDLSWLPQDDPYVKVYNKGQSLLSKNGFLSLPNIGRESHTYLTYIVDNYDTLPNVVFFTQGSPDHMGGHPIEYFIGIQGNCSENHHVTKGPYYTFDSDGHLRDHVHYGQLYKSELNFYDWFTKYIDSNIDPRGYITWYMGATFSVKKEKILSRSREYYQELLKQFPDGESNPEVGHYFERSWYYMFNAHL